MGSSIIIPPAFQRPTGKLYLDDYQINLVSGDETLVELETIPAAYNDGIENVVTHRITPGRPGFYAVVGQVSFMAIVADKDYEARLKMSGGPSYAGRKVTHASRTGTLGVTASTPAHYFSATDYVELWAVSEAGVDTVDINTTEVFTFLALQRVR